MHNFSTRIVLGEDDDGYAVYLFYPFAASPSRPAPAATDVAALKDLNEALRRATQAAIDAGCRVMQDHLGVASGDVAAAFFSNPDHRCHVSGSIGNYVDREMERAEEEREAAADSSEHNVGRT